MAKVEEELLSCCLHLYKVICCPALRGRIDLKNIILKEDVSLFAHYTYFWLYTETGRNYRL
jgi:hypothetical protein